MVRGRRTPLRNTEPGPSGGGVVARTPWGGGGAARSACSSLSSHRAVTTTLSLAVCHTSQGTLLHPTQMRALQGEGKERRLPLLWPPLSTAKILHHTLYSAACLSPLLPAYYSDFTMLIWIMWIFALCFDWNSRTWFRK